MAFRTEILKSFRFDKFFEQYPTYVLYDDQDICLRIKKYGYRLVQAGNARLKHNISPSEDLSRALWVSNYFNAYRNWNIHITKPSRCSYKVGY